MPGRYMGRNDPAGYGYPVPTNLKVGQDSEDLDELFSFEEAFTTTLGRLDPSGDRISKVNFEPLERDDEFPYDEPDGMYGAPNTAYGGRGSAAHSVTHSFEITPKNTEHSAWDDLDEIIGYPALLSKGGSSQRGTAGGLGTGWARNPPKDWDESELDEDFDPAVPPTEVPVDPLGARFHDLTDDDIEKKLTRIWGIDDNPNAHIVKRGKIPDVMDADDSDDMIPQGSAWGELVKLMMMKDLMKQPRKHQPVVVIRAGEANDEDHYE